MLPGQTGDKAQVHIHVPVSTLAGMKRAGAVRQERMGMQKVDPECHKEEKQSKERELSPEIHVVDKGFSGKRP